MHPTKAVVLVMGRGGPSPAAGPRVALPPAPLLPVANRALLGHALDWLARAGVAQAAVVVPEELADRARRAVGDPGLGLRWLERRPDEPVSHSLGALAGFLEGEPFVLHLADSLARQSLRSLTRGAADSEALLVVDESSPVELAEVLQLRAAANGGRTSRRALHRDSAGVAVVGADALAAAGDLDREPSPDRFLEVLADRIHERGGRVRTHGVSDWWRFRGGAEALLEGNRFALEGRQADYAGAQLVDSEIQGAVIAHPQARIESSVVRGPAILGARARLREAYVGPYTSIGDDVAIEGAEVEHSVILPGASIRHLGGRLEASVIGPRSRVFRDFRLPRALRLTLGEGAEVSLT